MCDSSGFLGEIVGRSKISAEEADLALYVLLQEGLPINSCELAMNGDGSRACNGCYLPGSFAASLKASNGAVENYEDAGTRGVAVAIAKDMLKLSVLL